MKKKKKTISNGDGKQAEIEQPLQSDSRLESGHDASSSNIYDSPENNFPIVGIGASAGGLAAFEAFFSGMPVDTDPGMAFVLVQHLAPDHKSILSELVRRYTRMQVFEVVDGVNVMPNCAYIIPPNHDMAFLNGSLQLLAPAAPRGQRLPIDFFFRSLAQDQRERAICIVLSGTGSDGTAGIRAVKGEGGMVMAQLPETTEFSGMPQSAIATGLVDYVLPPAEMPAQIFAYVSQAFNGSARTETVSGPIAENTLKKVFILVRAQTGHDFSKYKPSTVIRRVERRMAVHQIETIDGYIRFLHQSSVEVEALFRDLLIGVTSFFRDREIFASLEKQVIPRIFEGKQPGDVVRVWTPGCSTGEEAYSIAILLQEHMELLKQHYLIQVFATDIDEHAISIARGGQYPASIVTDVSPDRLERFFSAESDGTALRIRKGIRDMLVFSEQDVIKDPPFSKVDLISCRNLLIYMGGELQKKLIPLFHYALNPGGFLFLGSSETVGEFTGLFSVVDRVGKLYCRKDNADGAGSLALGKIFPPMTQRDGKSKEQGKVNAGVKLDLRELTEQALLNHYTTVGVLVNGIGDILYLHGRTGLYLEPPPGEAGAYNILKMAREGLRRELTISLRRAVESSMVIKSKGLQVKTNGGFTAVKLKIIPVLSTPDAVAADLYLVVLEEASLVRKRSSGISSSDEGSKLVSAGKKGREKSLKAEERVTALMQELRAKEEYLQTINEELNSSNEEMQSINEELQSTNEELETSKEELQSVNEELSTVNSELQSKVADLSRANNDMNNFLAGTGIGTIFVDHQLHIVRFTPAVTKIINLIQSDLGRPVGHIATNLRGYGSLVSDVQSVLNTLVPREAEVETNEGDWYMLRIIPYRTTENVIEGAVITFDGISEMKKAREALREINDLSRLAGVVRDALDAIIVQDIQGRVLNWNPAAERLYGWSEAEAREILVDERIPTDDRERELAALRECYRTDESAPFHARRITKDGHVMEVIITGTALVNEAGKMYAIATTERKAGPRE